MDTSPHHTILRKLYDLYTDNLDDRKTLESVKDISWSLGMHLGYPYAYFELAELVMNHLHDPQSVSNNEYYVRQIEAQLRIFEEHKKGTMTERRKAYEAERTDFPDIALVITFEIRNQAKDASVVQSASMLAYIEDGSVKVKGGNDAMRLLVQRIGDEAKLDPADARYSLEKIARHLPKQEGLLKLSDWRIRTKEDEFPPFMA